MSFASALAAVLASFVATEAPCPVPGSGLYDRQFRAAATSYLPVGHTDRWCWVKALAFAESSLRHDATSPVGAQGLLQVMPETFRETLQRVGLSCLPYDAGCSITVGTAYLGRMLRFWSTPRPKADREDLSIASYNAGPGSLLRAQQLCFIDGGECVGYDDIVARLPEVTGHHATETIRHVEKVNEYQGRG